MCEDVIQLEQKALSKIASASLYPETTAATVSRLPFSLCRRVPGEVTPLLLPPPTPRRHSRRARQARPTCSVMHREVALVSHPEPVYLFLVTFHQLKGSD